MTNPSEKNLRHAPTVGSEMKKYRERGNIDYVFFALVIILLFIGTVMVFSASYTYARQTQKGDSYFFARKQILFAVLGIAVMLIASKVDTNIIRKFTVPIFIASLALMLFVIIAPESIAPNIKGAKRWINLPMLGSFQPSEVYKFAIILLFADYIPKKRDKIISDNFRESFVYGVLPYGAVGVVSAVVMYLQPHMSGLIIIALIIFMMMFLGETKWKYFGIMALVAVAGLAVLALTLSHAVTRLEVWRDPFSYMSDASGGKGWQPAQALYAISAGGIFGVGLGNSNQKQLYLPEPQNDYIFPIFCEEFGFIGAVAVILLYVLLIYRGVTIAMKAVDRFSRLLALGIVFQVAIQTILNICVVTNILPSTGISLPFFSYGGSSGLVLLGEMGIVLGISRYSLVEKKQPSTVRRKRRDAGGNTSVQ